MPTSRRTPPPAWQHALRPRGRVDCSDDPLARFDAERLKRLLKKRGTQHAMARIKPKEALELALRIIAWLPVTALRRRRLISSFQSQLDAAEAARLDVFAMALRRGYAPSGARPHAAAPRTPGATPQSAARGAYPAFVTDGRPLPSVPAIDPTRSASGHSARHDGSLRIEPVSPARAAEAQRAYDALMVRVAAKRAT